MSNFKQSLIAFSLLTTLFCGAHADETAELQAFATQRFHVDYSAQNDQAKSEIAQQYTQIKQLSDVLLSKGLLKDDIDFAVAQRGLAVEIWVQKFMKDVNVSDTDVKTLYEKLQPKMPASYKLSNILVKSEKEAKAILKTIQKNKTLTTRLAKFRELAKTNSHDMQTRDNGGEINWVNIDKIDSTVQAALRDKKANDIVKVEVQNIGWQILYVEDIKPEHKASFEEVQEELTLFAKQQQVQAEIQKIISSK